MCAISNGRLIHGWWDTLSGEVTQSFFQIWFPSQEGFTLKGKNLLLSEQILFLRVTSILDGLYQLRKQTGSHETCLPLQTWQKKMEVYLYTLSTQ